MKNRKGFTLTEILIVMVVAGILLALILPNTLRAIERGNVTALRNDVNSIDTALFMCFSENRNWGACDDLSALNDGETPFLEDLPINPFQSGRTPGDGYGVVGDAVAGYQACIDGGITYPADIEEAKDVVIPEC